MNAKKLRTTVAEGG